MSLSQKIFIVVLVTTMCVTGFLYLSASVILLGSFDRLEEQEAQRNVARGLDALAAQVAYLDAKVSDWGNWDDAYTFIQDANPDFVEGNITTKSMSDLKIDLMLFVDNAGQIVYGKAYDVDRQKEMPVSPAWQIRFAGAGDKLLQHPDLTQGQSGVVMLPEGPLLVAARPILHADGRGPSRGTVLFGRLLDEGQVRDLAQTTHLSLSIKPIAELQLPANLRTIIPRLQTTESPVVQALDRSSIVGFALISDLYGRPALALRMDAPRTIFAQGQASINYFGVSLLAIGLICAGITMWCLRRLVLSPVKELRKGVQHIATGDLNYRIRVATDDELGQVAAAFNNMAGHLQDRDRQLGEQAAALQVEVQERRRAETELQTYAARLEGSNRELEEFAYVASHDLQEPLRKIRAFGDRLRDTTGAALGDQGLDYLSRMQNAAERMQNLIEGLLTYSRVTTKAQPFVSVDLNRVACEVMSDLETRVAQVNGSVEIGPLPVIDADPLQMRQLIQNLIGNALKFHRAEAPPVVKVTAERLNGHSDSANLAQPGSEVCRVYIQDNGIGFDEKYTDRIFQVFQRLHGRGVYEGAGIGLSVCRKITERHGGAITAMSTPGQGSTFMITLPMTQPQGGAG